MQIIQIDRPGEIVELRDEYPNEDLIFSRMHRDTLYEKFRSVLFGIFDFDFTLIHERSQWHEVQEAHLNGQLAKDEDRDRDFYYGAETDFGPSPFPENDWWLKDSHTRDISTMQASYGTRSIMRWAQAGITKPMLQNVGASLKLRDGVSDVFDCLSSRLIISFGIEELIAACLKENNLKAMIAAIRLIYDDEDKIITHHPRVITNITKGLVAQDFIRNFHLTPGHVISIGDSVGDIEMMLPSTINILLLPRNAADTQIAKWRDGHLTEIWRKTTCVIISDSLWPVHKLLIGKA